MSKIMVPDLPKDIPMKLDKIECDACRVRYNPDAIGLVTWLTLIIGARRSDGGGHDDDKDFCSEDCLIDYLAHFHLNTKHPYKWEVESRGK